MTAAQGGASLLGNILRAVKNILSGHRTPYPVPDPSNIKPNLNKTSDNNQVDVGWQEGVLSDGRPYRGEFWTWNGVSTLTFFMSARDLECASNQELEALLEREGLLKFKFPDRRYVAAKRFVDASGNDLWSINVVLGDDEETFLAKTGAPFNSYRKAADG